MRDDIEETNSLTFDPLGRVLYRVLSDMNRKRRRKREAELLGRELLNHVQQQQKSDEHPETFAFQPIPECHASLPLRLPPVWVIKESHGEPSREQQHEQENPDRMIADESHADQPREREGVTRLRRPGS